MRAFQRIFRTMCGDKVKCQAFGRVRRGFDNTESRANSGDAVVRVSTPRDNVITLEWHDNALSSEEALHMVEHLAPTVGATLLTSHCFIGGDGHFEFNGMLHVDRPPPSSTSALDRQKRSSLQTTQQLLPCGDEISRQVLTTSRSPVAKKVTRVGEF